MMGKEKKIVKLSGHGKINPHMRVGKKRFSADAILVLELKEAVRRVERLLPPQLSRTDLAKITDLVLDYVTKAGGAFKQEELDKIVEAWVEERKARIPAVKPDYPLPTSRIAAVFPKDGPLSYKNLLEIFNPASLGTVPEEIQGDDGRGIFRYSKGKWMIDFDRELLDQEIRSDGSRRIPILSQLEWKVWIAMLDLAREMYSSRGTDEVWVAFSDADIVRRLGEDPQKAGGTRYNQVRRAIWNIAAARPGLAYETEDMEHFVGMPFCTYFDYAIDKRTGQVFKLAQINPNIGEATLRHIRRELQREGGQTQIEWIEFPREFLESSDPKAKARIRNHLLRLPDDRLSHAIGYRTIAEEWAGFPQRELRRPKQLKAKLEAIFDELIKEGDLEGWRPEIKGLKMWDKSTGRQFWKVRFKRKRRVYAESERAVYLVEELMEWQLQPEFKIRKSPEELRDMLTATVNAYGVETCREWLDEALRLGYNPQWFWHRVTCEKLDRGRGKDSKQGPPGKPEREPKSKRRTRKEEPQGETGPMSPEDLQKKARDFIRELEGKSGESPQDSTG